MAMIVDAFAGKLLDRLTSGIEEKSIMVLGVKDELQRLRRRMERISRVLEDAERRRIQDVTVKGWVDELKDLMYDADDIIDLCMIQGNGLLQDDHHQYSPPESSTTSTRSSSLPELDIVGWDIRDATKSLVELLVSTHHDQKCCLFAIVGMGGIGKTTLAQQIYNDSKINDDFVLHSWIWVLKSFRSRKTDLLKEIIRNTGGSYGESTTIAELQRILCGVVHGKSLFLVLDDVWDADMWIDLIKNPIERTTTKCRVLVTTRDRNTAQRMDAIHIHNVNKLPSDSGWELICRKVFRNNEESDMQKMMDIGMQIVEKCDGLPVAIKAIAGVLKTKEKNKREWENVLNSGAWDISGLPEELRGALYLSYEELPSALKHCFLFCSLNPLDREFNINEFVPGWIAEGFIKPCGKASMEDVAKDYFMELIQRSFLQPSPLYANIVICTMHDLFRALAQFLTGDESFVGDLQQAENKISMKKLRRLAISTDREGLSIPHIDCLRSLWLHTPPSLDMHVIGSFKHLRLLFLQGDKIENIPDSIGNLVHLRLLHLRETTIRKLPDSMGNLINLQFLIILLCKSLHILPGSITKLCNLRKLNVYETPLNFIPKGIGKLEHLNEIVGFIIEDTTAGDGGGRGCNLEELQTLKNLNFLRVENLEKASSSDIGASVLSNKPRLRELLLGCTGNNIQQQEMDKIVHVFDELCPPPCLEILAVVNYFGSQYPKWMTSISTALRELTILKLTNCSNCPELPQLGQLPQLTYLNIDGATAVASIGTEFLGNGGPTTTTTTTTTTSVFPKLKYLVFWNMTNWEEWSLIGTGEENSEHESTPKLLLFPHLIRIYIHNCPKLKALPRGLNHVQEMQIIGARSLSRVSELPALRELEVVDCPMLECVEKLESLHSLKMIDNQEKNSSLPEWLISFLQQRQRPDDDRFSLHLECSAQALKGCLKGGPYWVFLQQVPRLAAYAEGRRMYLKYTKEPFSYQTNLVEDIN